MSEKNIWMLMSAVFMVLQHSNQGSFIVFEKTPDVIETYFTPTFTLRCSLQISTPTSVTPTSASGASTSKPGGSGKLVGRDVSKADDNDVKFVTSLVITRNNGEQVADVLPYSEPTLFTDQGRLNVSGHLSHTSGEQGYLLLTWVAPDDTQAGNYTCEANGVNNRGHNLVFSRDLEVEVVTPSQADLISHVHRLEMKNDALESKVDQILQILNQRQHVENGTITCHSQGQNQSVTHHFRQQYTTPPVVHIGVMAFLVNSTVATDQSTTDVVVGHYIQLLNVDVKGFTISCADTRASFNFDYQNIIDWVSLPTSL